MERIASEQSRPQKAAYLESAPSLRHALGKLSLERHSLKPVNEEDDPDVQQVEMLLQAYFIQMDNTFNQLETMNEYISDTEVRLTCKTTQVYCVLVEQYRSMLLAPGAC